jgi:AcrR family transcriptional regulator
MVTKRSFQVRQLLLAAATEIVVVSGSAGLRVDAVAQAAAVNKRMIYHYFGDRDGLVASVYAAQADILMSSGALQPESRKVFRLLLEQSGFSNRLFGKDLSDEVDPSKLTAKPVDLSDLQRAVQVLLPKILTLQAAFESNRVVGRSDAEISSAAWHLFALDLARLALPVLARGVNKESKRSHTTKKPTYRIISGSRRKR